MRRSVSLPPADAGDGTAGTGGPAERRAVAGPGASGGQEGLSDAAVIEQSWRDPEWFAVFFDRHADEIHRYAARRLGRQVAGDVVSEVFLAAFRNRGGYDLGRGDARPWLYGISAKVISQQMRAEGRRARAMATAPVARPSELPVEEITDRIVAAQMWPRMVSALAGLSPDDRELVLLVAWAGLSYDEAAQAMEIPLGTVRSRLHRTRARIRRSIGPVLHDKEFPNG